MPSIEIVCHYDVCMVFQAPATYIRDEASSQLVGYSGDAGGVDRIAWSFDLSDIPPGSTIDEIIFAPYVEQADGDVSAAVWDINAYGTDGSADPDADADEDAYNRCDGTLYLNDTTEFRGGFGQYMLDLTGTAAVAHAEAIIAVGGVYSIACNEQLEAGGGDVTRRAKLFGARQDPEFKPRLIIEYTEPPPEAPGNSPPSADGGRWTWR